MSMLMRWEPFNELWKEMGRVQRDMDRLFTRWGGSGRGWPGLAVSYPAMNVWEDADNVFVESELPGLKLQDLEIYVTGGNQLTVKGNRQPSFPDKVVWHRQERPFGSFTRVLTLPFPVDANKVEARFEHGVLTIRMPKSEQAKPRKIAVKAE